MADIPLYVIPIVGREISDVVPELKSDNDIFYKKVDTVKDFKNSDVNFFLKDKKDDISLSYKLLIWEKVEKSGGVENFTEYFSGLCNALCTKEAKSSIAKHFSLWKSYADADIKNSENKFIVVIEDDNTLKDSIIIHNIIIEMQEKNIDIFQLRETFHNSNSRILFNQENNNFMYSYTGGYDFTLSAYVIRLSSAIKIINEIIKNKGISTSLSFEMYKLEKELKLNRQVLNDSSKYILHNTKYLSKKRANEMKNGIWNRVGKWMAHRFPDFSYYVSHPLVSFFGIFGISIIGALIILFIIIMIIFNLNSKLLWFLAGMLFTYIV
uniref:p32 n=1 Tax=Sheeppox virus TaxID=10266 RepID=V5U6T0_SHEV|nr:P32 [Sheeppox virus]